MKISPAFSGLVLDKEAKKPKPWGLKLLHFYVAAFSVPKKIIGTKLPTEWYQLALNDRRIELMAYLVDRKNSIQVQWQALILYVPD